MAVFFSEMKDFGEEAVAGVVGVGEGFVEGIFEFDGGGEDCGGGF